MENTEKKKKEEIHRLKSPHMQYIYVQKSAMREIRKKIVETIIIIIVCGLFPFFF